MKMLLEYFNLLEANFTFNIRNYFFNESSMPNFVP